MKKSDNSLKTGKKTIKNTAITAAFAAVIAVCAWICVPFPVPFTFQTFGVFCALKILGGKRGTLAILLYISLGAAGLPVFSGFQAGVGVLFGPTGGYIWGFLIIGVIYMLFSRFCLTDKGKNALLFSGLLLCYLFGTLVFYFVSLTNGNALPFSRLLLVCVIPYVLPDAAKLFLADVISKKVSKFV